MSDLIDNLKTLFADSATFRTWTGTANQGAALARVHYGSVAMDAVNAPRPYVLLRALGDGMERKAVGLAAFSTMGTLRARFVDQVAAGKIDAAGEITVANKALIIDGMHANVLAVLAEIQVLGRTAGYIAVRDARLTDELDLAARSERAEMIAESVPVDATQGAEIEWGLEPGESEG